VVGGEGLAGAGVEPDFGPILRPIAGGVGGGVGGEDGFVEFEVGDVEPGGALVVEVGEGAFFEAEGPLGIGVCLDRGGAVAYIRLIGRAHTRERMSDYVEEIVEQPMDPLGGASGRKRRFRVQFLGKENNPEFPYTVANEVVATYLGIILGLNVPAVLTYRIHDQPLVFIQMLDRDPGMVQMPPASSSSLSQFVSENPEAVHAAIIFDLFVANNDRAFGPLRRNLALDVGKRLFLYDQGNACFYRNRLQAGIVAGIPRLKAVARELPAMFDMSHKGNHYLEFLTNWTLVESCCQKIAELPDFVIRNVIERIPDYLARPDATERAALGEFLIGRKGYLIDHIIKWATLFPELPKRGTNG
jgi:hypothetical protein